MLNFDKLIEETSYPFVYKKVMEGVSTLKLNSFWATKYINSILKCTMLTLTLWFSIYLTRKDISIISLPSLVREHVTKKHIDSTMIVTR